MDQENPTAGDSGASIEERLTRYLSADTPPEQPKEQPTKAETPKVQEAPAPADTKTEKPEEGAQEEVKQPQLSTADLADILGIEESALDVDADGKVQLKTKIDGKEGAAKLAEVLKTYQIQGHAENRARAVAEQEKALQTRMQEVEQAVKARVDHIEQMANVAGAELMREYQQIDWNSLRQSDPGNYAALQQDFQNRKNQIQAVFQNVHAQRTHETQKVEAEKQKYLAQEAEKLPQLIPEWKDAAVRDKEVRDIVDWATKKGFSHEQIKGLNESSALHVAIVRNAMLFDRLQSSKAEVENKVRTAPKIVKPGQAQQDTKETKLRDLTQNVRKTGGKGSSVEDWLKAKGIV